MEENMVPGKWAEDIMDITDTHRRILARWVFRMAVKNRLHSENDPASHLIWYLFSSFSLRNWLICLLLEKESEQQYADRRTFSLAFSITEDRRVFSLTFGITRHLHFLCVADQSELGLQVLILYLEVPVLFIYIRVRYCFFLHSTVNIWRFLTVTGPRNK